MLFSKFALVSALSAIGAVNAFMGGVLGPNDGDTVDHYCPTDGSGDWNATNCDFCTVSDMPTESVVFTTCIFLDSDYAAGETSGDNYASFGDRSIMNSAGQTFNDKCEAEGGKPQELGCSMMFEETVMESGVNCTGDSMMGVFTDMCCPEEKSVCDPSGTNSASDMLYPLSFPSPPEPDTLYCQVNTDQSINIFGEKALCGDSGPELSICRSSALKGHTYLGILFYDNLIPGISGGALGDYPGHFYGLPYLCADSPLPAPELTQYSCDAFMQNQLDGAWFELNNFPAGTSCEVAMEPVLEFLNHTCTGICGHYFD